MDYLDIHKHITITSKFHKMYKYPEIHIKFLLIKKINNYLILNLLASLFKNQRKKIVNCFTKRYSRLCRKKNKSYRVILESEIQGTS